MGHMSMAFSRTWIWAGLHSVFLLVLSNATNQEPVKEGTPKQRAHSVYAQLLKRKDLSPGRDPNTLAGFPEAPRISRQLQELAASKKGEEGPLEVALSEALASTGYYSKVTFRTRPTGGTVKYRLTGRTTHKTAHEGPNILAIGFYYVWAESQGNVTSDVDEYEIIDKKISIVVRQHGDQ